MVGIRLRRAFRCSSWLSSQGLDEARGRAKDLMGAGLLARDERGAYR
jgi:hypothetical protein